MLKTWIKFSAGLGGLLAAGALILLAAEAAVRFQPVQAPAPAPDDFVSVLVDERLFTVFAALNALGYDAHGFDLPYHPARQAARDYLAGRRLPSLERLRWQLSTAAPYPAVVWALHFGGPPKFPRQAAGWHNPSLPALLFFGLDAALRDFYREADLGALWLRVQPLYEAEAAAYRREAPAAVQAALDYARLAEPGAGRVVVIPNLLDAYYSGYGPDLAGTAYVVVGPTENGPDASLVRHEANHSFIGPLVQANLSAVEPARAERLQTALRGGVQGAYGTWESFLEECVVRAVDARLAPPEWRENGLRQADEAGLRLTRPLAEKLVEYEASGGSLADFMPALLASLNRLEPQALAAQP